MKYVWLSWCVILVVIAFLIWFNVLKPENGQLSGAICFVGSIACGAEYDCAILKQRLDKLIGKEKKGK